MKTSGKIIKIMPINFQAVIGLLSIIILWGFSPQQSKQTIQFWLGYTKYSFREVNPPDASAAVKVYAETLKDKIAKRVQRPANFTATIYETENKVEEALKSGKLDLLSLTAEEYFPLKKKVNIYPFLATTSGEDPFEQYVLIIRNDMEITRIANLAGKRLSIPNPNYNPMLKEWLFNYLMKNKMPDINETFKEIKIVEKESNAVYDVFFKNSDCTIIRKKVFSTLCELNPQLKNSLSITASSEPMVLILTAANSASDQELFSIILEEIKEFHLTLGGKNILNIFKAKRFIRVNENHLKSVKNILDENAAYRKVIGSKRNK